MSLQEAEQAARSQAGPSSAPAAAASEPIPAPTTTTTSTEQASLPPVETESATTLPPTMTQPLHNANDTTTPSAPGDSGEVPHEVSMDDNEEDEEEMLRRAMALSRGDNPEDDVVMAEEGEGDDEEDEEAAIARAIAMSLEEDQNKEGGK
jgi:26S proteasome regulatory subunit N10